MADDISAQISNYGIPIRPEECIGDTLDRINNSFIYLGEQADLTNDTLALTAASAQRQLNRHETRINELSAPLRGDIISAPWTSQTKYLSTVYNNVVPSNKGGAGTQIGFLSANGAGNVIGIQNTPLSYEPNAAPPSPITIVTYGFLDDLVTTNYAPLTALNKEIVDRATADGILTTLANSKIETPLNAHWPTGNINTAGYILTYDPNASKTYGDKWVPRPPAAPTLMTGAISCDSSFVTTYIEVVPNTKGGSGSVNGILSANGQGFVSPARPSIDYLIPSDLSPYAKTVALSSYLTIIEAQQTYNTIVDHDTDTLNLKKSWIKNPLVDDTTNNFYTNNQFAAGGNTYGVLGQSTDAFSDGNVLTLVKTTSAGIDYNTWVSRPPAAPTLTGAISSKGGYSTSNLQEGFVTTYAQVVPSTKGGAGSVNGILKADGSGVVTKAVAGVDYFQPPLAVSAIKIEPDARNNSLIKYDDYQKTWRVASPEDEPFAEVNFIYGLAKQQAGWYSGCAYSERRVIAWGQLDGKGPNDRFKFSKTNSKNYSQNPQNYSYIPFYSEYDDNGNIGNNIHFFDLNINKKAYIKDVIWNWSCGMAWVRNEDHGKNATGTTYAPETSAANLKDWVNGPKGAEDSIWVIGKHFTYVDKVYGSIPSSSYSAGSTGAIAYSGTIYRAEVRRNHDDYDCYVECDIPPELQTQVAQAVARGNYKTIIEVLKVTPHLTNLQTQIRVDGWSPELRRRHELPTKIGVKECLALAANNGKFTFKFNDGVGFGALDISHNHNQFYRNDPLRPDGYGYVLGYIDFKFGSKPQSIQTGQFVSTYVWKGNPNRYVRRIEFTSGVADPCGFAVGDKVLIDNVNYTARLDALYGKQQWPQLVKSTEIVTVTEVNGNKFVSENNVTHSSKFYPSVGQPISFRGIAKKQATETQPHFTAINTANKTNGYALNNFELANTGQVSYMSNTTGSIGIEGNGGAVNKQTCGFVQVKLPGFPRVKKLSDPKYSNHPLYNKWIKEEIVKIQCKTDPGVPGNWNQIVDAINNADKDSIAIDDPIRQRAAVWKAAGSLSGTNDFSNFNLWGALTNFGNLYVWGRSKDGCFGLGRKEDNLIDLQINTPALVGTVDIGNDVTTNNGTLVEVNQRNFAGAVADFEYTSAEFDATSLGVITLSGYDEDWPDMFPDADGSAPHQALFFAGDNSNFQVGAGLKIPAGDDAGKYWPTSVDYFIRSQKMVEIAGSNQYGLCNPSQITVNNTLTPTYINDAKKIVRSLYGGRQANGYIDMQGRLWTCGNNMNGLLGNCGYVAKVNPAWNITYVDNGHYSYGASFIYRTITLKDEQRLVSGSYGGQGSAEVTQVYDFVPQFVQEYPFRSTNYPAGGINAALTTLIDDSVTKETYLNSLGAASQIKFKGRGYFCEAKVHTWQDSATVGNNANQIGYDVLSAVSLYNKKGGYAHPIQDKAGVKELMTIPINEKIAPHTGSTYIDYSAAQGGNGAFTVSLSNYRPRPKFVDAYIAGMNAPYLLALAEIDNAPGLDRKDRQYNLYACGQNGIIVLDDTSKDPNQNIWQTNHGYLGIDSEALTVARLLPCVYKKEVREDDGDTDDLGKIVKDRVRDAVKLYCSDTNGSRNISYTSKSTVKTETFTRVVTWMESSHRRSKTYHDLFTTTTNTKWATATYANLGASGYVDDRNLAYIAGYNTFNDPPDYNSISYQYFTRLPINNVDDMVLGGDLESHKYQFFRTKSGIVWGQGEGVSNVLGLQNDCYVPIRIL